MKPIIIYPCEWGNINKIDEDYTLEKEVASELGFLTYNFNYDEFVNGDKLKLSVSSLNNKNVVYRGWMMTVEQYRRFYSELKSLGGNLVTTPEEYEYTHHFINSYDKIDRYTPKTIWFRDEEQINWDKVRNELGDKFIVKDYVKSVKGFDFPEYLESSMTNEELDKYIDKFKQLRGNLYQGGIVLKKYVQLDKNNGHTHEFRGFFINHGCRLMYHNSDNKEDLVPFHMGNEYAMTMLHSCFYTIDYARLENGEYIVIEVGDGQVSGIPLDRKIAKQLYKYIAKLEN